MKIPTNLITNNTDRICHPK